MQNKYLYSLLSINIIFVIYIINFLFQNEYLPSPFIYDKNDTFMDFFNPLYWAYSESKYTIWNSVYPPLSFIILKFINMLSGSVLAEDPFLLREVSSNIKYMIFLIYLLSPALVIYNYRKEDFSLKKKLIIYFIFISSIPFLFTLERGNLIILSLPLLSVLFLKGNDMLKILCISLLINLKPYFILLIIPYFLHKKWKILVKIPFFSLLIYVITTVILGSSFFAFLLNLSGFNTSIFSMREIMSIPSSISNFSIFIENYKDIPMPELFNIINILITFFYYLLLSFVAYVLIKFRESLSEQEIFLIILLAMMSFLYQIGGYSTIIFLILVPILYKNFKYGSIAVFLIFLPLDFVPIYTDMIYNRPSYFSNNNVDIKYTLGFGAILRPIMIYILLLYISISIFVRNSDCRNYF